MMMIMSVVVVKVAVAELVEVILIRAVMWKRWCKKYHSGFDVTIASLYVLDRISRTCSS
jgi:hypothetical protein